MKNLINITDDMSRRYQFVADMTDNTTYTDNRFKMVRSVPDTGYEVRSDDYSQPLYLVNYNDKCFTYRNVNDYTTVDMSVIPCENLHGISQQYITLRTCRIRILLPDLNPSIFDKTVYYYISATTHIGGRHLTLNSAVVSAQDFIASDSIKNINGYTYSNYYEFDVIDPFDIYFDNQFAHFRNKYFYTDNDFNDSTAVVTVNISVLDKTSDKMYMNSITFGSGSSILITDNYSHIDLHAKLHDEIDTRGYLSFTSRLEYNRDIYSNIKDYFRRNYNFEVDSITKEISILDNDNLYRMFRYDNNVMSEYMGVEGVDVPLSFAYESPDWHNNAINVFHQRPFDGWDEYIDGMYAQCVYKIYSHGDVKLMLKSNRLYITQDIYRFMIQGARKIYLNNIDMNIDQIKIINHIENKIMTMERPDDFKSNIVRPVFYKSYNNDTINIYRDVTQTLAIDLSRYINSVNMFTLMISGVKYNEIARQANQVIFKIQGNISIDMQDGDKINETIYYILDEHGEMVTTGKVTFIPHIDAK